MRHMVVGIGLLAMLALTGCEGEQPSENTAGFAGLGADAEGFARARPGTPLRFPEDHGAHSDFRIEWWYLTANLEDATGESLGVQWTLFRQAAMSPDERPEPGPWVADQLWMGHMAVSSGQTHHVAERFARGHSGTTASSRAQSGVTTDPFQAWLDDWRLESRVTDTDRDALSRLKLVARDEHDGAPFGYRLNLTAEGPLVFHGENGFSQKSADGQGSIYYSQPFYRVEGEVTLDGETRQVKGRAWLDREWSSQLLGPEQAGWDWFSLHLASGHKLMAFRLRGGGEEGSDYLSGTWISPDGQATALAPDDLILTPLATSRIAERDMPTRWRLEMPSQALDLEIEAPHDERWMETSVAYWEGEVEVHDRQSGEPRGIGYLEMTGY